MNWQRTIPLAVAALAFAACSDQVPTEPDRLVEGPSLLPSGGVSGAAFTTALSSATCLNGPSSTDPVNCNL